MTSMGSRPGSKWSLTSTAVCWLVQQGVGCRSNGGEQLDHRTAKARGLHDWRKYVTPVLAGYTVVRVVRKRRPDARDVLQLGGALVLFWQRRRTITRRLLAQ
jgi:hypothetical protein